MKKITIILLMLATFFILTGCGKSEPTYNVNIRGKEFTVDKANGTIYDGENIYKYMYNHTVSGTNIEITYPDASTYWETQNEKRGAGYMGWSDDYDENRYVEGEVLVDAIRKGNPKKPNTGNIVLMIVLVAIGLWNVISPYSSWYVSYGWRYKNAEPSDVALTIMRISGVILIIVTLVMVV